ncbi:MAG: hypothetical protein ACREYE_32200 [Gammaproteobacteria bacterium]
MAGGVMELLFPEGGDLGGFNHAPIANERDRPTPRRDPACPFVRRSKLDQWHERVTPREARDNKQKIAKIHAARNMGPKHP